MTKKFEYSCSTPCWKDWRLTALGQVPTIMKSSVAGSGWSEWVGPGAKSAMSTHSAGNEKCSHSLEGTVEVAVFCSFV
jgi:hypothetical protein